MSGRRVVQTPEGRVVQRGRLRVVQSSPAADTAQLEEYDEALRGHVGQCLVWLQGRDLCRQKKTAEARRRHSRQQVKH
jgi:hypothetical protein